MGKAHKVKNLQSYGRVLVRTSLLQVKTELYGNQKIQFAFCVNAAGASAAEVASLAGVGNTKGLRCLPLPIEKRYVSIGSGQTLDGRGWMIVRERYRLIVVLRKVRGKWCSLRCTSVCGALLSHAHAHARCILSKSYVLLLFTSACLMGMGST